MACTSLPQVKHQFLWNAVAGFLPFDFDFSAPLGLDLGFASAVSEFLFPVTIQVLLGKRRIKFCFLFLIHCRLQMWKRFRVYATFALRGKRVSRSLSLELSANRQELPFGVTKYQLILYLFNLVKKFALINLYLVKKYSWQLHLAENV